MRTLAPNVITSSFTPNIYAYNLAFNGQQYSYSATIAILMGVLTIIAVLLVQRIARRKGDIR
jgi:multiple sugar transport system permease protein